jgi:hypothetical protein
VLAALANARAAEQAAEERVVTVGVLTHLGMELPQGDRSHWPAWQTWCAKSNVSAFPALPASIAVYVLNARIGDRLEKVIGSISVLHQDRGLADPTLSPVVIEALDRVLPRIEPPRSWPAERKLKFARLPRDLQRFVAEHHRNIETEMRRAQNEAALAKRKENTNGTSKQESTAAAGADRIESGGNRKQTAA